MSKTINAVSIPKTFSFEWHIEDLDQRHDTSTLIKSEFFNLLGCIWHLELELEELKFRLCRDSVEDGTEAFVDCKLALLTSDGLNIFEHLSKKACEINSVCTFCFKSISYKPLTTLPGSILVVRCEIVGCNVSFPKDVYFVFRNKVKTERVRRCFSIENVKKIIKNEEDVTIRKVLYDPIFSREFKKCCLQPKDIEECPKCVGTKKEFGITCSFFPFGKKIISCTIFFGKFMGPTQTHLSILNTKGETVLCTSCGKDRCNGNVSLSLDISQQDITYFPDDIMRIQIEIDFKIEKDYECDFSCFGKGWDSTIISQNSNNSLSVQPSYLNGKFQKDLFNMLKNGRNSDFSLKVEHRNIPVHKAILEARSSVFRELFETNKTATSSDILNAVNPKSVDILLCFIYTGQIDQIDTKMAHELYKAANKCALYDLKKHCTEVMINKFTPSSLCDLLLLAHENQDKVFKGKIHKLILDQEKYVLFSEKWKKMLKDHTDLALETLEAVSELRLELADGL